MQSCKMGAAQASVDEKPPPQQLQRKKLHHVRIVVAGCSYKTMAEKLINKFVSDEYRDHPAINIGIDFVTKRSNIDDEIVCLQVFDVSRYLRYRGISPCFFRGNNVGLMVLYDVRDEQSFKSAQDLILTSRHSQVCM